MLSHNKGLSLVEFMVGIALSMSAILVIFSVYVTSFTIDSKTIRYSRLSDEVNSIKALLTDDIKRAGYWEDSEELITTALPAGNTSRCEPDPDPELSGCSHDNFRDVEVSAFAGEIANSCILFAYDENENGTYEDGTGGTTAEAYGYRLRDDTLEIRQAELSCTANGWTNLTDPDFVVISNLTFTCLIDGVTPCTAANLPVANGSGVVSISYVFNATLTDDNSVTIQASDTVVVRNASYN